MTEYDTSATSVTDEERKAARIVDYMESKRDMEPSIRSLRDAGETIIRICDDIEKGAILSRCGPTIWDFTADSNSIFRAYSEGVFDGLQAKLDAIHGQVTRVYEAARKERHKDRVARDGSMRKAAESS